MVHNSQNYWDFGFYPSYGTQNAAKQQLFRNCGNAPTLLGLLERAKLNHWTSHVTVTWPPFAHWLKNFPTFYGTRSVITVFKNSSISSCLMPHTTISYLRLILVFDRYGEVIDTNLRTDSSSCSKCYLSGFCRINCDFPLLHPILK
jgi:hypothetical protein